MDLFDLTLRFDDPNHSLTASDGLPIDQVAKVLASLSQALSLNKDSKVVLSEIRGNCYALNLSTNSFTAFETMKVIHRRVSQNDYRGLSQSERAYVAALQEVLGKEYTLDVYDQNKDFRVRVDKIVLPATPQFYFQIASIYGIITSIGGQTIDGASYISIGQAQANYTIKLTQSQEAELYPYFKKNRILFTLRKKIRFDNDSVVSAELESFEVLEERSFASLVSDIREKYPEGVFGDIDDSVDAVRKLRDNT